jgi:hypothetical protein
VALGWAAKQKPGKIADKLVLIALADRHNEEQDLAWPSVKWLCEFTGADRKTIITSLTRLETIGLIADSGQRFGQTKQVKGYTLAINGSEKGIPKTEPLEVKSPAFPIKQSQKRDTEPSYEPSSIKPKGLTDKRTRDFFPCPDDVDPIDWSALKENRKAKRAPLTEGAHRQIVNKLTKWADAGWPPGPVVAYAAERGWTTVFETDEMKAGQNGQLSNYSQRRVASEGGKPSGWLG